MTYNTAIAARPSPLFRVRRDVRNILLIAVAVIALIAAAAGAYFTACHDAIYATIMSEVELERNGLGGDIMKIVRYKDKLFVANGNIYMKTAQPSRVTGLFNGQWTKVASNIMGDGDNNIPSMSYFLAADANYLYALVYKWMEDNDGINTVGEVGVYAAQLNDDGTGLKEWEDGNSDDLSEDKKWKKVPAPGDASYNFKNEEAQTIIFDNQVIPKEQNEKLDLNAKTGYIENPDDLSVKVTDSENQNQPTAYIRIKGYGVYKLNGTNAPSETVTIEQVTGTIGDNSGQTITGLYKAGTSESTEGRDNVFSAYCLKGTDYFTSYYGLSGSKYGVYYSGSYTTKDSDGDHYVSGSSYLYFFKPGENNSGGTRTRMSVGEGSVYSIAVTSDYLLVGTHNGMTRVAINSSGSAEVKIGDTTLENTTTYSIDSDRRSGSLTVRTGNNSATYSFTFNSGTITLNAKLNSDNTGLEALETGDTALTLSITDTTGTTNPSIQFDTAYTATSGSTQVSLNLSSSLGSEENLPRNGNSIITENVFMVFAQDPTASFDNNDLYAASQIYGSITSSSDSWDDVGLYAKYPDRDNGTWNRDGTP